jgi:hypothetical protein
MKKICIFFIVILITCYAHALILPSGEEINDAIVKYVYRDSSGRLLSCTIKEPVEIQTPSGKLKVRGMDWYGNGALRACSLDGEVKINTPVGELNPSEYISWHENGALQSCNPIPAVQVKTSSGSFKIWGEIFWYNDGTFMGGILAENAVIEGTPYEKGTWVMWTKHGKFRGRMKYDWQTGEWSEAE